MAEREDVERVARAICAERCAFYGEPPCYVIDPDFVEQEWQPENCNEPGCKALAMAALAAMERK